MPRRPRLRGHRELRELHLGAQRETYAYDAGGALESVHVNQDTVSANGETKPPLVPMDCSAGSLQASFTNDLAGRVTRQVDWNNGSAAYDRTVTFNAKGQVASELTVTKQGGELWQYSVANQFGTPGTLSYALGAVTVATNTASKYVNGGFYYQHTATTTNAIGWRDGAVTTQTTHAKTNETTWYTNYTYGLNNAIESVSAGGPRARRVTFVNDLNGQTLRRDEEDYLSSGDPHEIWYRFGGRQRGYTGNNGTLDTSYTDSITSRTKVPSATTPFRDGLTGVAHADFDLSLAPINSYSQGGSGGSYEVRTGDTLAGIAAQLWGDSALWYKLAEANGMAAGGALVEGQRLIVPTGVMKSSHNADTFKPYDPSEIIGDINPAPKAAKKNKCGAMGAILMVAIAVAVAAVVAPWATALIAGNALAGSAAAIGAGIAGVAIGGAAGSIVSQGVGVATGIQDKFDWKAVAMAGISGAVGGGLGAVLGPAGVAGSKLLTDVVRGAAGSAITQGMTAAVPPTILMTEQSSSSYIVGGGRSGFVSSPWWGMAVEAALLSRIGAPLAAERGAVELVNPAQLRWTQTTAGGGGRADILRESMAARGYVGDPIDVVRTPNGLVTLDHTRAAVALEQGITQIPARVRLPDELLPSSMTSGPRPRFGPSTTWGEAMTYRASRQTPPLPPTGTSTPPRLPPRR